MGSWWKDVECSWDGARKRRVKRERGERARGRSPHAHSLLFRASAPALSPVCRLPHRLPLPPLPPPPPTPAMVRVASVWSRWRKWASEAGQAPVRGTQTHSPQFIFFTRVAPSAHPSFSLSRHTLPLSPYTQSKKRGLSLEEKKAAVLGIFHETQDVFQLKVRKEKRASERESWKRRENEGEGTTRTTSGLLFLLSRPSSLLLLSNHRTSRSWPPSGASYSSPSRRSSKR